MGSRFFFVGLGRALLREVDPEVPELELPNSRFVTGMVPLLISMSWTLISLRLLMFLDSVGLT